MALRGINVIGCFSVWPLLLLAACVTASPPKHLDGGLLIAYEVHPAGPVCGRGCEARTVTVASDGRMWLETSYWHIDFLGFVSWRTNQAELRIEQRQFIAFRDLLAPYRSLPDDTLIGLPCRTDYWGHHPRIRLVWLEDGRMEYSAYDLGCHIDGDKGVESTLLSALHTIGLDGPILAPMVRSEK